MSKPFSCSFQLTAVISFLNFSILTTWRLNLSLPMHFLPSSFKGIGSLTELSYFPSLLFAVASLRVKNKTKIATPPVRSVSEHKTRCRRSQDASRRIEHHPSRGTGAFLLRVREKYETRLGRGRGYSAALRTGSLCPTALVLLPSFCSGFLVSDANFSVLPLIRRHFPSGSSPRASPAPVSMSQRLLPPHVPPPAYYSPVFTRFPRLSDCYHPM